MKTITKTFNIYTIEELKKVDPTGYKNAIETASNFFLEHEAYWQGEEFVKSAKAVAEEFDFEIYDYSFSAYNGNSYMSVDLEKYLDLTNDKKKELVSEMNKLLQELHENKYVDAHFTGNFTDEFLFEYFLKEKIKEVTFNDLHKQFENMVSYGLESFLKDLEMQSEEQYIYDNLLDLGTMFTSNGEVYEEENEVA